MTKSIVENNINSLRHHILLHKILFIIYLSDNKYLCVCADLNGNFGNMEIKFIMK